ncbi:MAG: DUF2608 domain-containing protein [Alphaproteobacteria bacterium]|nr:DUF2608 domain-containing protein [Alphaproteobacteria bacterium]
MKKHLLKYACVLPLCVSLSDASINEVDENIINENAKYKFPYITERGRTYETNSLTKISDVIGEINERTWLAIDIDSTTAMQTTAALAPENVDEYDAVECEYLKENPDARLKYNELEAHLYETFHEILVDKELPEFLKAFRVRGGKVIALTALENCMLGGKMLIDIRYQKMKDLGVDFAESFPNIKPFPIVVDESIRGIKTTISPYYSNGIITTRPYSKDQSFFAFLKKTRLKADKVVFMDDLADNVCVMQSGSLRNEVKYIGIHYLATTQIKLKYPYSKKRLEFQFDFLYKYKRFPSDAEAERLMAKEEASTKDEKQTDNKLTENSENTTPTETEKSQPHEEDKKEENTINEEEKK